MPWIAGSSTVVQTTAKPRTAADSVFDSQVSMAVKIGLPVLSQNAVRVVRMPPKLLSQAVLSSATATPMAPTTRITGAKATTVAIAAAMDAAAQPTTAGTTMVMRTAAR